MGRRDAELAARLPAGVMADDATCDDCGGRAACCCCARLAADGGLGDGGCGRRCGSSRPGRWDGAAAAGRAAPASRPGAGRLMAGGLLLLMCISASAAVGPRLANTDLFDIDPSELSAPTVTRYKRSVDNMTVCPSITLRNHMADSWKLADCDVIEGHLRMVLINRDDINTVSFPRLKQVTHYVIFYRVKNLMSFSEMFPNLAVIRGHRLFRDYALVLYENQNLRDLGLKGLTRIMRGAVRIEKNPYLCYLRTVDWERLTGQSDMVIQDNGGAQECAGRTCMSSCANSTGVGGTCWNQNHCQTPQSKNCHPFCEGGCRSPGPRPSPRDCVACRDVVMEVGGECMEHCPPGTYLFGGWRCINRTQCMQTMELTMEGPKRFKAHRGQCVLECPPGFTSKLDGNDQELGVCEKCKDICHKWCRGHKMLENIKEIQRMHGCTHINGSLRIEVSGENVVQELETNLKDIRYISGYLRVSYSDALVSMDFLPNLEVIGGRSLENRRYSLYFMQNVNLQSLWPNTTNLRVERGHAFFHFNHHLCLDKIHALLTKLNMSYEDVVDVGPMTNGDKVACRRQNITASVKERYAEFVVLQWENFQKYIADYRQLISYNVFYREAPPGVQLTIFSGRDACGQDQWNVVDFSPEADPGPLAVNLTVFKQNRPETVEEMLPNLKPFTQYAFYVETILALTRTNPNISTGRSDIIYFTTREATPSKPENLNVENVAPALGSAPGGPQSLLVSWDPPARPNGIITEYTLSASHSDETEEASPGDNICTQGGPSEQARPSATPQPATTTTTTPKPRCCACPAEGGAPDEPQGVDHMDKRMDQIDFENSLQDLMFTKQRQTVEVEEVELGPKARRRRRSIDGTPLINNITAINGSVPTPSAAPADGDPCVDRQGAWCRKYQLRVPANETGNGTLLRGLRHFAKYTIEVKACQAAAAGPERLCSMSAIKSRMTRSDPMADALQQRPSISNHTEGGSRVILSWVDPPDPNGGAVLSYFIEIQRVDDERVKNHTSRIGKCKLVECKTPPCERRHELDLTAGNNSLRVQAFTAAGYGPYSEPVFWVVQVPDGSLAAQTIVFIVLGLLFVLLVSCGCVFFVYRRFAKQAVDNIYTSWNPYYGGQISYQPDEWEVDIEKVEFDRVIGKGSFGSVFEGTALLRTCRDGPDDSETLCRVAIKTLLEDASMYDRQAFLSEASLMKEFNCYHVVRLMGIVSNMSTKIPSNIPRPPFVIMELMARGDLKSYLRSMRPEDDGVSVPENSPVLPHIYQMAIQIADGMAYLTQMNSVHRDLAARNCMVTEDMTIKIGDFGMTRHLYDKNYYKKGGKGLLPVRWMGPESIRDGVFTSQSDVWSFGVVLWEMCTYAAQPYQGLTNEEVMQHVLSRNRMARPANCPERLYQLMHRCWEYQPDDRPTFIQLVEELLRGDVGQQFARHSFYHTQWPLMRAEAEARDEPDALTPLTADLVPSRAPRRPRIAETEDLSDEDGCEMEVVAPRRPARLDPEGGNYAEFEKIRAEARGHGSQSSAENSKAHSLQFSSDGSKGSKASNGSARNGYLAGGAPHLPRTAQC